MKRCKVRTEKQKMKIFNQVFDLFKDDMVRSLMKSYRSQKDRKLFEESDELREQMLELIPISILKKWLEINL